MADLGVRVEQLEKRLERVEAALRQGPPWAMRLPSVLVTFEDVAVEFNKQEWAMLDVRQKELYRSVMENNYEMLVSLYSALSKPDLLTRLDNGEEPCTRAELDPEGAGASPKPPIEPQSVSPPSCVSNDIPAEMEPEESGEKDCEEPEGGRSLADTASCSPQEGLGDPKDPAPLPGCISPTTTPLACPAPGPHEATAVPADLGQPTPSPSCPLSMDCPEVVNPNWCPSPLPAAADAEVEIPTEVPQEEAAVEKPPAPETPAKDLEEEKGKDSDNINQDPVSDVPKEPVKEKLDVCGATVKEDPKCAATSLGEPVESCPGRAAACQRNSTREKYFCCPVCSKTFLLKINLIIHQWNHNNCGPYVCAHCARNFMSKKKFQRHIRARAVHGFCQPSEVEQCSKGAPCPASKPQTPSSDCGMVWGKPNRNRHPLAPGKIIYTCNQCMENFSSLNVLILHQQLH